MQYNEIIINTNPTAKNISFFVWDVIDLYSKIPPASPKNKTRTPAITGSIFVPLISGLKKPESNVKNATK